MKQDEIRRKLIDGTIRVIARDGLDGATTKHIGTETEMNEAYIYRYFVDKEDLFAKAFECLDEELLGVMRQNTSVMYMTEMDFKTRARVFYSSVWRFLIRNDARCIAYVRYYYSTYFKKNSARAHKERYAPLMDVFRNGFKDEANVWMIMNHVLMTMLDFAVKVFDGAVPDDEDTEEHVFRLVYYSAKQYFRNEEKPNEEGI